MKLTIKVANQHFMVSDGCSTDNLESNISNNPKLAEQDKWRNRQLAPTYLFYSNIALVRVWHIQKQEIDLTCKQCGETYRLKEEDLAMADEEYVKIHGA